jgi:hypothetical protein
VIQLYAIVDAPPPEWRALPVGAAWAVVAAREAAPEPSEAALREHDARVRAIEAHVGAILPARFATLAADERDLIERLAPRADALAAALAEVAGRVQMTLRLFASGASAPAAVEDAARPGTSWLRTRARAAQIPELDRIRAVLGRWVKREHVERHDTPPLVASVYHLVAREDAAAYAEAARAIAEWGVRASGPFPPYAFAEVPS